MFSGNGGHQAGRPPRRLAVNELRDAGYALYHTATLVELADALGRMGQVAGPELTPGEYRRQP